MKETYIHKTYALTTYKYKDINIHSAIYCNVLEAYSRFGRTCILRDRE